MQAGQLKTVRIPSVALDVLTYRRVAVIPYVTRE